MSIIRMEWALEITPPRGKRREPRANMNTRRQAGGDGSGLRSAASRAPVIGKLRGAPSRPAPRLGRRRGAAGNICLQEKQETQGTLWPNDHRAITPAKIMGSRIGARRAGRTSGQKISSGGIPSVTH